MSDYIPQTDDGFRTWGSNFAMNISANPGLFMLTPAEAAGIQSAVDNYIAKLEIADNELTRTKQTIADKDDALSIAKSLCRQYAIDIKTNAGITDGDKLSIGVRPVNNSREKIDCPTTQPLLNILGNTPGVQTVVYADSSTPDKKARPFGASEMQLFMAVATEADAPLSAAKFVGKFTRNPIDVSFDETDDGKIATYYGRWASVRGETGPFSLPISMRIAA